MTFDARSKERLQALGRTLPKKLPAPEPSPASRASGSSAAASASAEAGRHPLEREQDPADLFRALIKASPDGTVPPHLLDRLRDLERTRQPAAAGPAGQATQKVTTSETLRPANGRPGPGGLSPGQVLKNSPAKGHRRDSRKPGGRPASEDQDLYTAFAQLLLEDDGEG